uniref:Uncharacterized protein n=1 Tax=Physcomitrium patens TaxID=3218 RepID=A0A2K1JRX7_PHYPA|nr:hypothetical protein PHYPA_016600 [Physcomitrium patens]
MICVTYKGCSAAPAVATWRSTVKDLLCAASTVSQADWGVVERSAEPPGCRQAQKNKQTNKLGTRKRARGMCICGSVCSRTEKGKGGHRFSKITTPFLSPKRSPCRTWCASSNFPDSFPSAEMPLSQQRHHRRSIPTRSHAFPSFRAAWVVVPVHLPSTETSDPQPRHFIIP